MTFDRIMPGEPGFVRKARLAKTKGRGQSALDLAPLDLGRMLKPLGTREEWYDDMLEGRV